MSNKIRNKKKSAKYSMLEDGICTNKHRSKPSFKFNVIVEQTGTVWYNAVSREQAENWIEKMQRSKFKNNNFKIVVVE